MPDGSRIGADAGAERAALEAEARLVRNVRLRLVAWSSGTTLLVLVVLAVALYVAVAGSLAASSESPLRNRADEVVAFLQGERPERPDEGLIFGGGSSGTFGLLLDATGAAVRGGPRDFAPPEGLPDAAGVTAARSAASRVDVRTGNVADVPVRILTERVDAVDGNTYFVQIVGDRSAEVRTLQSLLAVLLVGGFVVVLVAAGFGAVYARRALVPIRDSLAAQRTALRRQREFAADASHELRTPLTVIRSSVEHLRRHDDERVSDVGEALDDISAEVDHLTALVDDLLLLARSDSGAVTLETLPVELDDVAVLAASSLGTLAATRGVRLEVDPQPALVTGDPARLRQLVRILVDNAIRHSPRDAEVVLSVRSDEEGAELVVADDGPGIRDEDLPRVFDRFWRAPGAPSGGTGLGLAIAKWIVERHDGTIAAANRPEGGARFTVRLPATRAGTSASTPAPVTG
jgi:signal transduction histidine kinase